MCKNSTILKNVIFKHHPLFKKNKIFKKEALKSPMIFNVERLVEECLAHIGGYKFVDESGRDFDDKTNSDSKTLTIDLKSRIGLLKNIENKIGSLRIVIYNPHTESVDFLYMTYDEWNSHKKKAYGQNTTGKTQLRLYYSDKKQYSKFEKYRVHSFKDLAETQRE